jgi:hypothetical protein
MHLKVQSDYAASRVDKLDYSRNGVTNKVTLLVERNKKVMSAHFWQFGVSENHVCDLAIKSIRVNIEVGRGNGHNLNLGNIGRTGNRNFGLRKFCNFRSKIFVKRVFL